MAVPRLRVPSLQPVAGGRDVSGLVSDEVELYHRTYTTLLRSSGETLLRVLEPSHRAINSSLHPLAGESGIDLGAFLYTTRRLPESIWQAKLILLGQEAKVFTRHGIGPIEQWQSLESPARRRHWYHDGSGTFAVLLASASDLDDLIPTLVAYQIEWNKLRTHLRGVPLDQTPVTGENCAELLGGVSSDWEELFSSWSEPPLQRLETIKAHGLNLRIRMLGGSQVGYQRMTRHWWRPVQQTLNEKGLSDAPTYFVSSNAHSLVNLVTGTALAREDDIVAWIEKNGSSELNRELEAFRTGRTDGAWENFLYYSARTFFSGETDKASKYSRREAEEAVGITHISSTTALRVSAQVIAINKLDPAGLDPRLGPIDPVRLAGSPAVIVNIEYPLGVAAYNILSEISQAADGLRGAYILGKAATLNADVGDVLISNVIHDEHSRSTYWLDNAFSFEDIAPYLVFGSGLDNQRALTVKSTFLQNRSYLDFYYREAFTVVEMEAGPYCNAVYELADVDRYPTGEAVNFSKLPIDFGIIHYASDTPYTQARTLGAPGLSYYGMDSTYASSVAILRRIFALEGLLGTSG